MVLTPHMLVGAAIGSQVSNYWLAFLFGLISHYLVDVLPHWDYLQKFEISNPIFKNLSFLQGLPSIFILIFLSIYVLLL